MRGGARTDRRLKALGNGGGEQVFFVVFGGVFEVCAEAGDDVGQRLKTGVGNVITECRPRF